MFALHQRRMVLMMETAAKGVLGLPSTHHAEKRPFIYMFLLYFLLFMTPRISRT